MTSRDYDEKRDFMRMAVDCEVRFRRVGNEREFSGQVVNLSGRGLLFQSGEALTAGERLELSVEPPAGGSAPPLQASGEVVRVTAVEPGPRYEIAVVLRDVR